MLEIAVLKKKIMISEKFPMTLGGSPVASEDHLLTKIENGIFMPATSVSYLILHCSATRETQDYPSFAAVCTINSIKVVKYRQISAK